MNKTLRKCRKTWMDEDSLLVLMETIHSSKYKPKGKVKQILVPSC